MPVPIAYFCAEYGLNESLGIYSGGLGVLAGDHLKAASDMAIPLVGVGLFYRHGYFRQTIDADGHQEHAYPDYDPLRLPLLAGRRGRRRAADDRRSSCPVGQCSVAVWLGQVGRVPLLLLDTDIPDNDKADRPITHILYVRGREMRLHQEMVLGVGGVRALRALNIEPQAWHLNEGHSAFMLVERTRELTLDGVVDGRCARARQEQRRVHDPHAGLVPATSASTRTWCAGWPRRWPPEAASTSSESSSSARGTDNDPEPVRHDGLLAARDERRQRRVSHLHAQTANATWSDVIRQADPGHHQRRPSAVSWVGGPIAPLYDSDRRRPRQPRPAARRRS